MDENNQENSSSNSENDINGESVPPPFGSTPGQSASQNGQNNPAEPIPTSPEYIPPPPTPGMAPPQGTYYSNTQGFSVSGPKNDPYAVTALSTGVPAIIFGCCCTFLGVILGIVAIVFGYLSMGRIDNSGGQLNGKGLAIAGLVCGAVGALIGISLIILNFVLGWGDLTGYYQ